DYLSAVSDGFAWQGILIGIVIALIGVMLIKNTAFVYLGAGLSPTPSPMATIDPIRPNALPLFSFGI
ncbi:hypothetical protein, partial [Enterococcus faecium]|uniref:hypothetical protein n=1 Tax=Enterococcus faecium TaxID=1352 RepID=UPI002931E697